MADAAGGTAKQFLPWQGTPLFWHAARAMSRSACVAGIVFVFPPSQFAEASELLTDLHKNDDLGLPWVTTSGGALRQDSVRLGLAALPLRPTSVLVHDAARPCLSQEMLRALCEELADDPVGGLLAVPVADTLKRADSEQRIAATEPRDGLWQAQTPQMFRYGALCRALAGNFAVTDEASAIEALGLKPKLVRADSTNLKVTYPADLRLAELILQRGNS